jgi:hypothetical protein
VKHAAQYNPQHLLNIQLLRFEDKRFKNTDKIIESDTPDLLKSLPFEHLAGVGEYLSNM